MSTFFLRKGIRLPIEKPNGLSIKQIDLSIGDQSLFSNTTRSSSNGVFSESFKDVPAQHLVPGVPLETRIEKFCEQKKTLLESRVVIRLADVDPAGFTQRALTHSVKNDVALVKKAIHALCEKTGVSGVTFVAHKGQDLGDLASLADQVVKTSSRHFPVLMAPLVAQKMFKAIPVLDANLGVNGLLMIDLSELLRWENPDAKRVVTVIAPTKTTIVRVGNQVTVKSLLSKMKLLDGATKIVLGSPLLGEAYHNVDIPLTVDTVTVFTSEEYLYDNMPCCNCGKCVKVCPSNLLPGLLSKHIYAENFEQAKNLNVHSCIECGCCAYLCPSKRPLVQYMKLGKQESLKL